MSLAQEILIARDATELDAFGAELIGRAVVDAVAERGIARVALSGGSTTSGAYRRLVDLALPWARIEWFWVDERAVPPAHERSNYRVASHDFDFDKGPLKAGKIHRMAGEAPDLEAAARDYEKLVRASFGVTAAVAFDVVTLGIGEDGHTASLFPGMKTVAVDDRLVLAVAEQPEKKLEARLTLTAPVILAARKVILLARGPKKRDVLVAARSPGDEDEIPSRLLQRARGEVVWLVDQEAAP